MMIRINKGIALKLKVKHKVSPTEIEECFINCYREYLEDTRVQHMTSPPTLWFIAETETGRLLKIVFIKYPDGSVDIKTAYEPNNLEVKLYDRHA